MTRSKTLRRLAALVAVAMLGTATATHATAQQQQSRGVTNIVLVHGAWADGSSWSKVIPLLAAKGLHVVAVQLPHTSLADNVATVQRAIALVDGPLPLVAHSFGGVVITESAFDLANAYPTPILPELRLDQFGVLKITPTGIREAFAQDLSDSEQTVLTATQTPTSLGPALSAPVSAAAWRTKPCWFVIAAHDRVVAPALQAIEAQQMNATSITLSSSHVAMLSHPYVVASFIRRAARDVR